MELALSYHQFLRLLLQPKSQILSNLSLKSLAQVLQLLGCFLAFH